jgi:hypothetical protein
MPNLCSVLVVASSIAACVVQPRGGPVPVQGTMADTEALIGRWEGTYRVSGGARRGVLRFELQSGADTAYGDVEITFSSALRLYGAAAGDDGHPMSKFLIDIRVVELAGGQVRGTLPPYLDPDCDCRTLTTFNGLLSGNRIEGTFTSARDTASPPRLKGTWVAVRRRP